MREFDLPVIGGDRARVVGELRGRRPISARGGGDTKRRGSTYSPVAPQLPILLRRQRSRHCNRNHEQIGSL